MSAYPRSAWIDELSGPIAHVMYLDSLGFEDSLDLRCRSLEDRLQPLLSLIPKQDGDGRFIL